MTEYVPAGGLQVARRIYDLVHDEMAPGTGVDPDAVWAGLGSIVADLGPKNQALLDKRDTLAAKIDNWYRDRKGQTFDGAEMEAFLRKIGYLVREGKGFEIETENVDPEISILAGPQLVVPIDNARYALNAANARWGSL